MRFLAITRANAKQSTLCASDQKSRVLSTGRHRTLRRPILQNKRYSSLIVRSEGLQGGGVLSTSTGSFDAESSVEGNEDNVLQLKELFRLADLNG